MIVHTIFCVRFDEAVNCDRTFYRSLTRRRRLTPRGIQRLMRHGCPEYDADRKVRVGFVTHSQLVR